MRPAFPAVAAVVLSLAVVLPAAGGGPPTISVSQGRVGELRLGAPASAYPSLVRNEDGSYRGKEGGIVCRVDRAGRLVKIEVTNRDLVTERLVRARISTLREVVRAYGRPERTSKSDALVVLHYPSLEIHFARSELDRLGEAAKVERLVVVPARTTASRR